MQRQRFRIEHTSGNNCFAYLSERWQHKVKTEENVMEVLHGETTYYMSCIWRHLNEDVMKLDVTFARKLGLEENDEVFVSVVKGVPSLTSVSVIPQNAQDREVLELLAERVEFTLLNQIRVVAQGQPIVVWVSKYSHVSVIPDLLVPNAVYGKLEQFSEFHIVGVTDTIAQQKKSHITERGNSKGPTLSDIFRKIVSPVLKEQAQCKPHNGTKLENLNVPCFSKESSQVFSVRPLSLTNHEAIPMVTKLRRSFHAFVRKRNLPKGWNFVNGVVLCLIRKVQQGEQCGTQASSDFLKKNEPTAFKPAEELTVRLCAVDDTDDEQYFNWTNVHSIIYVPDWIMATLNLKVGAKVVVKGTSVEDIESISSMRILSPDSKVSLEEFKNYLRGCLTYGEVLLNSRTIHVIDNGSRCIVRVVPEICRLRPFDSLDDIVFLTKESILNISDWPGLDTQNERRIPQEIEKAWTTDHWEDLFLECKLSLDVGLGLSVYTRKEFPNLRYDLENILIWGEIGLGKSTFYTILRNSLDREPFFVHMHVIECRSLKGKKVDMVRKAIIASLSECVYYQPSVLILDDLESITNVSSEGDEENTPDAINAARISDMLINTTTQYQQLHCISIIATCSSISKIGRRLRPARGAAFFRVVFALPRPEKKDRIKTLQKILTTKYGCDLPELDWDHYGNKTEGWTMQDLMDFTEKATFSAWKRHTITNTVKNGAPTSSSVALQEEDMLNAMKNFTPLSMRGIKLYKGEGHSWSDIGGLKKAKESLIEILQWPLKYPEIFKNAPIKLQNGVLLYGMPGTGKTLLGKAIANECGVNLISVKGPELLSKYIGVSESSVRDIFERALRAKPCVLFFDEFDSLAPRRGHDSTGVTDRVVNQLLTQMDGVEDREGVAVVAASSRPDLLDPALLRPGRLDKAIHCSLPDHADRIDILTTICKGHNISTDQLNISELAEQTTGFSGADLNAVITQARLSALEEVANRNPDGKIEPVDIKVTQTHLAESAKSTQPSLSATEKQKYARIYGRFSKNDNFTGEILKNQRATLA